MLNQGRREMARIVRFVALITLLIAGASPDATAQTYPVRTVTIVVASPPGGGTDYTARLLAEGLSKSLKAKFIVENKGGASGNIGTLAVARAAPDGHTLLLS